VSGDSVARLIESHGAELIGNIGAAMGHRLLPGILGGWSARSIGCSGAAHSPGRRPPAHRCLHCLFLSSPAGSWTAGGRPPRGAPLFSL